MNSINAAMSIPEPTLVIYGAESKSKGAIALDLRQARVDKFFGIDVFAT